MASAANALRSNSPGSRDAEHPLGVAGYARYSTEWMAHIHGPVAQLGERHNGIVEAKGSSPFRSTHARHQAGWYRGAKRLRPYTGEGVFGSWRSEQSAVVPGGSTLPGEHGPGFYGVLKKYLSNSNAREVG